MLARAGLVRSRREGTRVYSRLASDRVGELWSAVRDVGAEAVVDDLPEGREVVAYYRGPYCVSADDAVRLLRARGVEARRLDVGFPEWRRAGRAVGLAGAAEA